MNDDAVLLRRYAEDGSEAAFTELVRRHVDLVYGAALRRTAGDVHRAADVAQQVFTSLARDAAKLSHHSVLGAWLHTATRNAALNLMMSERRRHARELQAHALAPADANGEASLDWDRLRPVLDAAIDELAEPDRAAVVLRFLERRAFADIGAALRVSEDAARMRTERALDRLRTALARRGITSTAAALGVLVSNQPLLSAPAGLAATLASHSLAAASAGAISTDLTAFMTTKFIATSLLSALVGFAAGAYFGFSRSFDEPPPLPLETPRHSQLIASLRKENQKLKIDAEQLRAEVMRLDAANAKLAAQRIPQPAPPSAAPSRAASDIQKAMLNNLRQMSAASDQFRLENGRPPSSLEELVGETKYIRRLIQIDGENYAGVSLLPGQPMTVTTANGVSVTYDPTSNLTTRPEQTPAMARANELARQITPALKKAMEAYRAANNGALPPAEQGLLPYFATPQEGADFVEFLEAQKAAKR